jgi:uncharacterized delta-60 repeat protein
VTYKSVLGRSEIKKLGWIALGSILVLDLLIPLQAGRTLAALPEKWVARYNGPGNNWDIARAIAVDGLGNVYVTGQSEGSGSGYDYATIKYNTNGKQLWAKRYKGPGNGEDEARAIAVDGSGNVYVTGASKGLGTKEDYATIKYSTNGKQLWVARYNGPGNDRDEACAIAVDGSGNVYVTGYGVGSGAYYDSTTIKYNASGKQLWAKRHSGQAGGSEYANAIAVDGSGNVCITGQSADGGYATIKYNTNGKQLWEKTYNDSSDGANAIAVDGSGNVYVTGRSYGSGTDWDYATIKYSTNGKQLWVKRYNGQANDSDYANAIAVDSSGNVYVTGGSGWNLDSETGGDYATIKYSTNGKQLWVKRYDGGGYDESMAIAVDSSGNVYVSGRSEGQGFHIDDYVTIKYGANGKQLWVKKYNGPDNDDDCVWAIAVDGSGNVYVTGQSVGSNTVDYATIKY